MKLSDWHRCSRWQDNVNIPCPLSGAPGHEDDDDDREQDVLQRGPNAVPVADSPLFFAFDKLKKTVEEKRVKTPAKELTPVRELFPKPVEEPVEVPPIAAITPDVIPEKFEGDLWLENFIKRLEEIAAAPPPAVVLPPLPAPALLPEPSKVPAESTSNAVETATQSEKALTRSLYPWRLTGKAWDTGARPTPATVQSRAVRTRAVRASKGMSTSQKAAMAASTALVGAGAAYLTRRGGGGGGRSGFSAADMLQGRKVGYAR